MKTKRLSLRVDERTYHAIQHGAKTLEVSMSEFVRLLTLRDPAVVNLAVADFVVDVMTKDLAQEMKRWRRYWRAHPEKLLQVPERPGEGDP